MLTVPDQIRLFHLITNLNEKGFIVLYIHLLLKIVLRPRIRLIKKYDSFICL